MLSLLSSREIGQSDSFHIRRSKMTSRARSIELSSDKSMEQVFKSGVNSLDLEQQSNRYLISASSESRITVYDISTLKETGASVCNAVASIDRSADSAHKFSVGTVQWYPRDNEMFLTSSVDKSVKVWDSNTLQIAEEFKFRHHIYCHHMSSIATTHCLVAVASDSSKIFLCDLRTGSSTQTLQGHIGSVLSTRWSTRSDYILASGSSDNRILIWDVRKASSCVLSLDQYNGKGAGTLNTATTAHNGHVNGLSFTSDGLHLLSYGTDDCLRLWNISAAKNSLINYGKVYNLSKKNVQLAVSSELSQDLVFVPSDKDVVVFELQTGKRVARLVGHYGLVNCCYYHQPLQELFSGGIDSTVLIWSSISSSQQTEKSSLWTDGLDTTEAYGDAWSSEEG